MLYYLGMNKINKNRINLSFAVLAVLASLAFVVPMDADAASNYVFDSSVQIYGYQSPYSYQTPVSNVYTTPYNTMNYYPTPAQTVYYNYSQPATSNVVLKTNVQRATYVATSSGTSSAPSSPIGTNQTNYSNTSTRTQTDAQDDGKYSDLAATAIYGDDGFLPSGILQWIFIAILALIIILLVRNVFGGAKNYFATPLKHS